MKIRFQALLLLLALGALSLAGCAGKVVVTKVPESAAGGGKFPLDGVVYALPRTVVKVSVPVDRAEHKKALYADYAGLFFPDAAKGKDFVKAADDKKKKFSVGTPVFSTFGEPDPTKLYYVKITGWGPVDRTASLDYTEQGTVSGVQGGADNYTTDIVLAGISALAGVATRVVKFGGGPTLEEKIKLLETCPEKGSPEDKEVRVFFSEQKTPEVFLNYCQLDDKGKETVRKDVKEGAPRLKMALEAYKDIRDLNKARRDAVTGGTTVPVPSLELTLKEIDALVARSMAANFTGEKTKETWTPFFELRPVKPGEATELFYLDEACGVGLKQPLHAQDDPPDGFTPKDECKSGGGKTFRVRFELDRPEKEQLFNRVNTVFKEEGERSFRYLIPAATLVTLEGVDPAKKAGSPASAVKGGKAVVMVGQFGAEVSLPASSGGRSLNYNLKYFEATGAMKSFTLTSKTAMQGAVVNSLSTSANAILDAKKKQEQEAADKKDELNRLERQRKILEDRAKILELCEKPGMNCEP